MRSVRRNLITVCLFVGIVFFMLVLHLGVRAQHLQEERERAEIYKLLHQIGFLYIENAVIDKVVDKSVIKIDVKNKICNVNMLDQRHYIHGRNNVNLTTIYYITPTYPRPEQTPELVRLSHTLMHVPKLHWIVADDHPTCSEQVLHILRKTGLPFTHIASPKPYIYKRKKFPRGVSNRRAAIAWLRTNAKEGVMYFGDDDNAVDLQLFDEIRKTRKVSMFPVGLIGEYAVSAPVVQDGKVVGFFDPWPSSRQFPVDMAGFAVNLKFLSSNASMPYREGHEENAFLRSLNVKQDEIEPLADNCSKVLVWHTKTVKNKHRTLKIDVEKLRSQNYVSFVELLNELRRMGMADTDALVGEKAYIVYRGGVKAGNKDHNPP